MSRKKRVFDVDLSVDGFELPPDLEVKSLSGRRGPMATAIGENGEALRQRQQIEAEIRAENDALAHEFVRLKKLGLIVDQVPVDAIRMTKLVRDRRHGSDPDLAALKASILDLGLSNPIRVEPDGQGGYELVQGFRRLTAWKELRAETGRAEFDLIPAGLMAAGETMETLYRRMVDENLVRKDVSFAEMAQLARAYTEDGVGGCEDLDAAVNKLFASASPQKRSYIRRFARLMGALEKYLEHPEAIPRALGLDLADRLDADPMGAATLVRLLQTGSRRTAETEAQILRGFLANAKPIERPTSATPPRGRRRGRVSLSVPVGPGVRCTATEGKLELRAELDFGAIDRDKLEAAIEAFMTELTSF